MPYFGIKIEFKNYSEVRGYWYSFQKTLEITIIIPEDDFLLWDEYVKGGEVPRNNPAMEAIKNLCIKIWEQWNCISIQTEWEGTYEYVDGLEEIRKGTKPQVLPFAIIPECVYKERWRCRAIGIGNDGLLLEDDDGWE